MFDVGWKKEFARDTLALGGIAFYFIVIIRALIGPYWEFVNQLLISAVALSVLFIFLKKADFHVARGLILVLFTSLFYNEIKFSIFAFILFLLMLTSSFYLRKNKFETISGLIAGIICSSAGYFIGTLI